MLAGIVYSEVRHGKKVNSGNTKLINMIRILSSKCRGFYKMSGKILF